MNGFALDTNIVSAHLREDVDKQIEVAVAYPKECGHLAHKDFSVRKSRR